MYTGYLSIGGVEVINDHRVAEYARAAGLSFVRGCNECQSIAHLHGEEFVTPLIDANAGSPPPWWSEDQRYDASRFLGFMGIDLEGMSDSMRTVLTEDANGDGGYIGALRYRQRTTVVRMLAVAVDDCALEYGLEWLRTVDTADDCALTDVHVYACCPCVCGDDCDDPVCQEACVETATRVFYESRITSGPTVLSRPTPSIGAMAQIELVITSADPRPYTIPAVLEQFNPEPGEPYMEPVPTVGTPTDPFGLTLRATPRTLVLPRQAEWRRSTHQIELPGGRPLDPILTLYNLNDDPTSDVRVGITGPLGNTFTFRVPFMPPMSQVRLDFLRRKVFTAAEVGGPERLNMGFAFDGDGGLIRWPRRVNPGMYSLTVDTLPWSPGVTVEVALSRIGSVG